MMPKDNGSTPPPAPWITRPASITPIDVATAESTHPIASAASVATSMRSLPHMSPSRPMMGVNTDADNR